MGIILRLFDLCSSGVLGRLSALDVKLVFAISDGSVDRELSVGFSKNWKALSISTPVAWMFGFFHDVAQCHMGECVESRAPLQSFRMVV